MKAIWDNEILAEINHTGEIGNQCFPASSVRKDLSKQSEIHILCPWKGEVPYYTVQVNGKTNSNTAQHYANPKPEVDRIKNR